MDYKYVQTELYYFDLRLHVLVPAVPYVSRPANRALIMGGDDIMSEKVTIVNRCVLQSYT